MDRRGWWAGLDITLNRLKYLQFSRGMKKVDVEYFIHFDKLFLAKTDIHSNSWLIPQISHYPLHVERLLVMNFSSFSDISQGPQFWSNIKLNVLGFVVSDIIENISHPQYHTPYLMIMTSILKWLIYPLFQERWHWLQSLENCCVIFSYWRCK